MSLQKIKSKIAQLPPDELSELAQWLQEYQAELWDRQIARDVEAGRFDTLIQRVKEQICSGKCAPLLISEKNAAAIGQLRAWMTEEATDDPEEIRKAEEELAEFKRNMNANRAATGERLVFPE